MKGYRAVYVIGILGTMAYNVMQLAVPYATQQIVDLFLTGEDAAANLATKSGCALLPIQFPLKIP